MLERRKASYFERMVTEHKLMTTIVMLPYFDPWELVKFCRLNKASCHIMHKIVNYEVLFEEWDVKLTPDEVAETFISTSRALQVGTKCINLR